MKTFPLKILDVESPFYEGECVSLVIPTDDGQYGIQAGHSNMVVAVVPGEIRYTKPDGETLIGAVSSGIAKVEDGSVFVLVETSEYPGEIDEKRAERAAQEAQEAMIQKKSIQEYYTARTRMAREMSRLRVKRHDKGM